MTILDLKQTREYQDLVRMYEDSGLGTAWAEVMALNDMKKAGC